VPNGLVVLMARSGLWQQIAASYLRRYLRTSDLGCLTEALGMLRLARTVTEGSRGRIRIVCLSNLGQALRASFEHDGNPDALREAITVSRAAAELADAGRRGTRALTLSNLAMVLYTEVERTGDPRVAREAAEIGQAALRAVPGRHPNRSLLLSNLAVVRFALFEQTGDVDLLHEVVVAYRAAVTATRWRRGRRAVFLSNLAVSLVELFEHTGDLGTLREAVTAGRAAVAVTRDGHSQRSMRLSNLGLTLCMMSERTGDLESLREAIAAYRTGIAVSPDYLGRPALLSNLGFALQDLFERTGDLSALRESVEAGRAAVAAAGSGHPRLAQFQSNLGLSLQTLFERTGDLSVLRESVAAGRAAVAASADGRPGQAMWLTTLGISLKLLAEQTEDAEVLTESVTVGRAAVAAAPEGHRARGTCLSNLGSSLRTLSEQSGDLEPLHEAVAIGRAAVSATPADHPDRAYRLCNLAGALRELAERTGERSHLSAARAAFALAAGSAAAPVRVRIWAGTAQASADTLLGDHQSALAAMEGVAGLLPLAASRELGRQDRRHQLGETLGIGAQAVACALAVGRPERAVELLEQARGLLMAEAMGSRAELARLRVHAPDLLDGFIAARNEFLALDAISSAGAGGTMIGPHDRDMAIEDRHAGQQLGDRRRAAAVAWDALLARIRARHGLADFLLPLPVSRLSQQVGSGPIVMLTAHAERCDALILTADQAHPVQHVPLPGISRKSAFENARRLMRARLAVADSVTQTEFQRAQRDVHEILGWLWDTTAEPVLTALGYDVLPGPGHDWPRLWWCPVGVLSFLPLHAAGHHADVGRSRPAPRTVLDRVVSSYTATVRVLAYARRGPATTAGAPGRRAALIVGLPDTPGASSLPGVRTEIRQLTRLIRETTILEGADAEYDRVLDALPVHPVAHFACHAVGGESGDGADARLILHDPARPLTASAISRLDLPDADLAYLSSCSTSSPDPGDEPIHITSAFQIAGYRSVIGTLWPVDDRTASRIAAAVYAELTDDGTRFPAAHSALALHHAIRSLRASAADAPTRWTAHIHAGI
jgi:hypothetical protein